MNEEPTAEQKENDLAAARIGGRFRAHREQVARINRGNHAAAVRDQAHLAETVQHLSGKIEAGFLLRLQSVSVNERARQEFLRLKRHCACVGESLPQARAIVSNTFSC